jgi:hypothetical protein
MAASTQASNNPAGSSTPAGNTMQVAQSSAGARTRNVINLALPGYPDAQAYNFTATTQPPSGSESGFRNWRSQKYLHVHVSGSQTSVGKGAELKVWTYNSFAGVWGQLNVKDPSDATKYAPPALTSSFLDAKGGISNYYKFDIDGAERVAVQCTDIGVAFAGAEKIYVWLGVNSF